jgi:hypothetical protein
MSGDLALIGPAGERVTLSCYVKSARQQQLRLAVSRELARRLAWRSGRKAWVSWAEKNDRLWLIARAGEGGGDLSWQAGTGNCLEVRIGTKWLPRPFRSTRASAC